MLRAIVYKLRGNILPTTEADFDPIAATKAEGDEVVLAPIDVTG
jgi:hypothetical protein